MFYNICAGVLRAVGALFRTYLPYNINYRYIGLDLLFILGFKWVVEGAAYATLIGTGYLSCALCNIHH